MLTDIRALLELFHHRGIRQMTNKLLLLILIVKILVN